VPVDADKIARELRERIEQEVDALALQIDIPDIRTYTDPKARVYCVSTKAIKRF
jgi:hypothetical protein